MDSYITSKIDNKTYCVKNGKFTRHLRDHGLTFQTYYETYVTGRKEFCPYCKQPRNLVPSSYEYRATCGSKACYGKLISDLKSTWTPERHAAANERRAATNLEKYGVESVAQVASFKDKARATEREILECGRTRKELQQEKARATKVARYGDAFYNNPEAISAGWSNMPQDKRNEVIENRRITNLDRHGVINYLMKPEIVKKINSTNGTPKVMTMPSGREITYQGYENLAVAELLKSLTENEILLSDPCNRADGAVPFFSYTNLNGNICRYFPDIFIPHLNRIIEVKSRWWYDAKGRGGYESRIENNRRKAAAASAAGYDFEFWVYDSKVRWEVLGPPAVSPV